ncbi:MAG: DUF58 domain-containing protein [Longimicrobiales bacterium]|nr:DUF58 domain-containing protein [Longimicrobiales bacterium]
MPAINPRTATPGFLDPATLARIDNLELLARTVVDGFITGLHRSPYLGLSIDFAEHRPYNPGDDPRRIDWKLWARTDRYYVKEFEAETNANFTVLLDVSASMDFGSGELTKLDYARYLAACLAYFSRQQRDRVGLVTFDDAVRAFVPPSARHLDIVLQTLDRVSSSSSISSSSSSSISISISREGTVSGTGSGASAGVDGVGLAAAVDHLADRIRRRGIVVLISDFYEEPDRAVEAVKQLVFRGNDVIVFHVLDPAEIEFPFDEASHFVDKETGDRIPVVPETMRERYRQLIDRHIARLARGFSRERIDYSMFDTSTPLDYALFKYLSDRQQLSRVR